MLIVAESEMSDRKSYKRERKVGGKEIHDEVWGRVTGMVDDSNR